jgi:hypothetical protein
VEAESHQPLKGVKVQRVNPEQNQKDLFAKKGGEMMAQTHAVRTAADGTFTLDCIRNLAVFRKLGWYEVKVSFEHSDYERHTSTYTLTNAVLTPEGIPVVNTGDVALTPQKK